MAEVRVRVLADVCLDLVPVAIVVADLLAVSADGQQAAQGLDLRQRVLEVMDKLLALLLDSLALGNVAGYALEPCDIAIGVDKERNTNLV